VNCVAASPGNTVPSPPPPTHTPHPPAQQVYSYFLPTFHAWETCHALGYKGPVCEVLAKVAANDPSAGPTALKRTLGAPLRLEQMQALVKIVSEVAGAGPGGQGRTGPRPLTGLRV
jgi:hypothetical protein